MRYRRRVMEAVVLAGLFSSHSISRLASAQAPMWVTGYWYSPGIYGGLGVGQIDFTGLTHIVHYYVLPNSDGTLDSDSMQAVADQARALIGAAHSHGVKVLLGVAQTASGGDFLSATRPAYVQGFVANIMNVVNQYGYDGVDLDWEANIDSRQFTDLAMDLRGALDAQNPKGLLTGAFWSPPGPLSQVQSAFDQINVMTYDMCSPDDGFTWHNAALYADGDSQRRTVDARMRSFEQVTARSKLGLGIPFYGYVWRGGSGTWTGGASAPGQTWTSAPGFRHRDYRQIVNDPALWQDQYKQREQGAGSVPYISIDAPGSAGDVFATYEDEVSVAAKVAYAKSQGLGGVMVYELSADYLPGNDPQHPLLRAVAAAVAGQ